MISDTVASVAKPLPPNVIKPVPTNIVKPLPSNPIKPIPVNSGFNPNAKSTMATKSIPANAAIAVKPNPANPSGASVKPNTTANAGVIKPVMANSAVAKTPISVNSAVKQAVLVPKVAQSASGKSVLANVATDVAKKQIDTAKAAAIPAISSAAPVPKPKSRPDLPNLNPNPPPAVQPNVQETIKSLKEATNISTRNKEVTGLTPAQVAAVEAQRSAATQAPARESARRMEREANKVIDEQNQKNAKKYKLVACIENKAIQTEVCQKKRVLDDPKVLLSSKTTSEICQTPTVNTK